MNFSQHSSALNLKQNINIYSHDDFYLEENKKYFLSSLLKSLRKKGNSMNQCSLENWLIPDLGSICAKDKLGHLVKAESKGIIRE